MKYFVIVLLVMLCSSMVLADQITDYQLNNADFNFTNAEEKFSFLVAGHAYGAPSPPRSNIPYSVFPSEALLANIDTINEDDSIFLMLLGDSVHKSSELQYDVLDKYFLNKLDIPVFNSVGNHEMQNSNLYKERYGNTGYYFYILDNAFVVLDTGTHLGLLPKQHNEQFVQLLKDLEEMKEINKIFVFSHYLIWNNDASFNEMQVYNSYKKDILPVLMEMNKSVLWFSGDGKYPLYYKKGPKNNIDFYSTALLNIETDAMLKVTIDENVTVTPVSLTGDELGNIETYTKEYWTDWRENYTSEGANPFWEWNKKTIVSKFLDIIKEFLSSIIFYIGLLIGILICVMLFIIFRKQLIKRKKLKK